MFVYLVVLLNVSLSWAHGVPSWNVDKKELLLHRNPEENQEKELLEHRELWEPAHLGATNDFLTTNDSTKSPPANEDTKAIDITLDYEADCPFCYQYIHNVFGSEFFMNALRSKKISLKLLPYGNAQAWNVCQHGPLECEHNMLEACVIHYIPETLDHLQFIQCLETAFFGKIASLDALSACAKKKVAEITSCFGDGKGKEGRELIEKIAAETDKKHKYVPWVLVNGSHHLADQNNLKKTICTIDPSVPGCSGHADVSAEKMKKSATSTDVSAELEGIAMSEQNKAVSLYGGLSGAEWFKIEYV